MRFAITALAFLTLLAAPAVAVDPECDPSSESYLTPHDPASGPLAVADNMVRGCTSLTDARGERIESLQRCELRVVDASGSTDVYARTTVGPGELVRIAVEAGVMGPRSVEFVCENAAGASEPYVTEADFPGVAPAAAALLATP